MKKRTIYLCSLLLTALGCMLPSDAWADEITYIKEAAVQALNQAKTDAIADINAAIMGETRSYILTMAENYIAQINAATVIETVTDLRTEALDVLTPMINEPTAFSIHFTGMGNPVETEHMMAGTRFTFGGEDGELMQMEVNGATVTYPLSQVASIEHFRGTPSVSLHANQDPDENTPNFYTTFYSGLEAYILPEGVKAYTAEVNGENIVLKRIEDNILPQGEAVLLYSNELQDGNWTMTVADPSSVSKSNTNQFKGVDVATSQDAAYKYYMLSYGQDKLGFYKMGDSMLLSANKAFIVQSSATPAKDLRMVFADEETGISNVNLNDNDTLRYDNDNIYSVSGVRLNKLQKGINIVNGKKIFVN